MFERQNLFLRKQTEADAAQHSSAVFFKEMVDTRYGLAWIRFSLILETWWKFSLILGTWFGSLTRHKISLGSATAVIALDFSLINDLLCFGGTIIFISSTMFYDGYCKTRFSSSQQNFIPHSLTTTLHIKIANHTIHNTSSYHKISWHIFHHTPNTVIIASHTPSSHNKYIYRFLSPQRLTPQSLMSAPTTHPHTTTV